MENKTQFERDYPIKALKQKLMWEENRVIQLERVLRELQLLVDPQSVSYELIRLALKKYETDSKHRAKSL